MQTHASITLKQSLLSQEERIEAGHINPVAIEEFCEEKKSTKNKNDCDLYCTRSILECLSIYKEIFVGDGLLDSEEHREPSHPSANCCDKAANCCCEDCFLPCVGVSSLALISCVLVPLAFFADGARNLGLKCREKCKENKGDSEQVPMSNFSK